MFGLLVVLIGFAHLGHGSPALTLEDLEIAADTESVGSYVREVRAAPPQNYHRSYENDGDGEIGYSRKKSGGGKKGYQHFDTFHKKGGDNYEFEKQDSYGLDDGEQEGAYSEQKEKKAAKYQETPSEHDGEYYEGEGQHEGSHHDSGSSSEGQGDEGGASEAEGHDVSDYTLPEKYEYGAGDEYNF